MDNCLFLHQLVDEQDIIIEEKMIFTYDDHLNLAKKIMHYSNPKIKQEILNMKKPKKIILPSLDFIYLSEAEKERYFSSDIVSYFEKDPNIKKDSFFDNSNDLILESKYINNNKKNSEVSYIYINQNDSSNLYPICFNVNNIKNNNKIYNRKDIDISNKSFEPNEFYKSIDDSIKHIFAAKPFFSNLKNYPFKKLELEFFRKDLEKSGKNFYELFDGCIDCLNDVI